MESMKKLYSAVAALSAALIMWACGPAEMSYTMEYELQGLYTVNKHTVAPEFSDTFMFVNNMGNYDLETGDRALLTLYYFYDLYSGKPGQWSITNVVKKIPVRALSADIDTAAYDTPITGLQYLNFFNDFETRAWVWKDRQNICAKYKGVEEDAAFAMTVRGVKEGCVELDLFVDAPESEKETATLLTFDISNMADFLSEEDKALLADSIATRIYLKRMKNGVLEDWAISGNDFR
jgi:hypothetical protein